MEDNLMLSIYVATYNHEKYIVQALDSILMQETEYSYEILVGEDCSTDHTRAVLKEYEKRHPGKLKVFYREHNMNKEMPNNGLDLRNRCRGKYVIALEGDDYWVDSKKIDRQIRFLEENPQYLAVAHRCVVVDQNSEEKNENYPECKQREYTFKHYASEIMPGQLTTVMYRNPNTRQLDQSIIQKKMKPGDRATYFWLLTNGKVYCFPEVMSAYRHITDHGSSFSANYTYKFEDSDYLYYNLLEYARKHKNFEAEKYAEFLYFRNLLYSMRLKQCSVTQMRNKLPIIKKKWRAFCMYLKYRINKNILHKEVWL